ncbi:MAG: sulfatase [Chloroflexota bacterium]
MKSRMSRRDFLKLAGLLPIGAASSGLVENLDRSLQAQGKPQNVLVVVFDALSACNVSLYGYQRDTMPNLGRLAERAIVYHNHYANGNYTTPGTASLLTGTLPWTHRAFQGNTTTEESFVDRNMFPAFQGYHRLAYSHNPWANTLLTQFGKHVDDLIPENRLFLRNDIIIPTLYNNDKDIATLSWVRTMKRRTEGYSYSLLLSHLYALYDKKLEAKYAGLKLQYPDGFPGLSADNYFLLEDAIDWLGNKLANQPQPFLGYFHFLPPHAPYKPHINFWGRFENDDWVPAFKPIDLFFTDMEDLSPIRGSYDEFILYVDWQFGRFFDRLDQSGLLENTWIILTSDHGQMFERGIWGHGSPVLYDPVVRVPLVIFEPGRKARLDIHIPTSSVDVLPTLLHVTGQKPVGWSEGVVLPPFTPEEYDPQKSHYIVQARDTALQAPLTTATIALIKGTYKLMYFFGYKELGAEERIELYDFQQDPEELNNLYPSKREIGAVLLNEIKTKLAEVNEPYVG